MSKKHTPIYILNYNREGVGRCRFILFDDMVAVHEVQTVDALGAEAWIAAPVWDWVIGLVAAYHAAGGPADGKPRTQDLDVPRWRQKEISLARAVSAEAPWKPGDGEEIG